MGQEEDQSKPALHPITLQTNTDRNLKPFSSPTLSQLSLSTRRQCEESLLLPSPLRATVPEGRQTGWVADELVCWQAACLRSHSQSVVVVEGLLA